MMWGCLTCVTHKIGGRDAIPTQEVHTLTISASIPTCRVCKSKMTPLTFASHAPAPPRAVRPATPNGAANP